MRDALETPALIAAESTAEAVCDPRADKTLATVLVAVSGALVVVVVVVGAVVVVGGAVVGGGRGGYCCDKWLLITSWRTGSIVKIVPLEVTT
jgi:hypothetical protein